MKYPSRVVLLLIALLFIAPVAIYAQPPTPFQISKVRLFYKAFYIDVNFTSSLDSARFTENSDISGVTINSDVTKNIRALQIIKPGLSNLLLRIILDPSQKPLQAADKNITVCFSRVFFKEKNGTPVTNVCGTGPNLSDRDALDAEVDAMVKKLAETEKSSEEKNIFASGFAANGAGSDAEGGAVINLNSNDLGIPGLIASMHLKKTTAENADPKQFDMGLTYTRTFLFDPRQTVEIARQRAIVTNPASSDQQVEDADKEIKLLMAAAQKKTLGAMLLDFSGRLEGEALNFNVTNFVGDTTLQLLSRTKQLFGTRRGFWRFRFPIAGLEIGQSLGKGDESLQMGDSEQAQNLREVDWIARAKAGGEFNLYFRDPETNFLFRRIEANFKAVNRYLFRSEVMFDEETMMDVKTDKGNKYWLEADLRFYILDDENRGRFGFKVSFNRGSLPPVFAHTNSFQFGFIIESADDIKTSKQ